MSSDVIYVTHLIACQSIMTDKWLWHEFCKSYFAILTPRKLRPSNPEWNMLKMEHPKFKILSIDGGEFEALYRVNFLLILKTILSKNMVKILDCAIILT